jgi:hypothetical protein
VISATRLVVLVIFRYPGIVDPVDPMKIPLLLFSHVALGLAGWGIAREFRSASTAEQAENSRARSTQVRSPNVPGSDIVRSIESRLENARLAKEKLASEPSAREKILAALAGLALPSDPAAAIRARLATDDKTASIQAAALLVLWAKSNPTGALRFASDEAEFRKMSCDEEALELVGESIAPELALEMEVGHQRDAVFAGLARQLIASRSVEQLAALLIGLEADPKSSLSYYLGKEWPADRFDDFGRLVTEMRDTEMLNRIQGKLLTHEMANWMMRYVAEHPDREFARKLQESDFYFSLASVEPEIPLKDRLDVVMKNFSTRGKTSESIREDAMEYLASRDVSSYFDDDGPDLHYAFHHGKIEASELLARLVARFPEHAASGLLPVPLYQELAPHDPDRAAFLIADLPALERARVIVENVWSNYSWDTIGRVLSHFPDSDEDAVHAHRVELWEELASDGLDYYGKDYLHWILSLPDPLDRKLALGAIADEIDHPNNDDERVAELREIVGDIPLRDTP